jgi:hypothetical protein
MEEKERMSTNAQIVTNSTLEQCFSRSVQAVVDRALSIVLRFALDASARE